MKLKFISSYLLLSFLQNVSAATDKVICYYKSWTDESFFFPDDVDVNICTHVNFAFVRLNSDGNFRFNANGETILKNFANLKSKNPDVKLLLTVGGWTEDSLSFSGLAKDEHKQVTFVSTLLRYMKEYDLDGVDFDWVYPGKYGGDNSDKKHFLELISFVRENLDDSGGGIITIAVSSYPDPVSYDVNKLSQLVDAINLMTYDFHGFSNDEKTGANSPLYPSSTDSDEEEKNKNCVGAINNWINSGASPLKLILGLGFYGHYFNLVDPKNNSVGSPADGADEDYIAYNIICQLEDGWTEKWDDEQKVPYKYKDKEWISFDNAKSIKLKVEYAKERKLGGVMMWSVNDDDHEGLCGEKNVLLQAIKESLEA